MGDPPAAVAEAKCNFAAYAMGMGVTDYRGQLRVSHTGGLQGMVSEVTLLPQQNLGVIVLTNQESDGRLQAITKTVLDHYLGAPPKDWVASYLEVQNLRSAQSERGRGASRFRPECEVLSFTSPAAYAGRYRDPWYGDILIEAKVANSPSGSRTSPALTGTLEHWQYDSFVARWRDRSLDADAYVTFSLKPDGSIRQVRMKAVSPSTDFSFDFQDLVLSPMAAETPAY